MLNGQSRNSSQFLVVRQDGLGGLVHWECDQFRFLRAVCLANLTGSVRLILCVCECVCVALHIYQL